MVLRAFEGTTLLECEAVGSDVASSASALASEFCNAIVINLWRSDLGRDITWNSRALKAVFSTVLKRLTAEDGGAEEGGGESYMRIVVHMSGASRLSCFSSLCSRREGEKKLGGRGQ